MNELTSTVSPAAPATQPFRVVLRNLGKEFVTHLENVADNDGTPKERRDFYYGHYFDSLTDAMTDFAARCKRYNVQPKLT